MELKSGILQFRLRRWLWHRWRWWQQWCQLRVGASSHRKIDTKVMTVITETLCDCIPMIVESKVTSCTSPQSTIHIRHSPGFENGKPVSPHHSRSHLYTFHCSPIPCLMFTFDVFSQFMDKISNKKTKTTQQFQHFCNTNDDRKKKCET